MFITIYYARYHTSRHALDVIRAVRHTTCHTADITYNITYIISYILIKSGNLLKNPIRIIDIPKNSNDLAI